MSKDITTFLEASSLQYDKLMRAAFYSTAGFDFSSGIEDTTDILLANTIIGTIANWIKNEKEVLSSKIIFNSFESLCTILNQSSLKNRINFNIISMIIERNIKIGLLDEKINNIDNRPNFLQNFEFLLNQKVIQESIEGETYLDSFIALVKGEMSLLETSENNVRVLHPELPTNLYEYKENHKLYKKHYLDKKESYNQEDIDIVIEALKQLGVTEEIYKSIKYLLEKDLNKRNKKVNQKTISFIKESKVAEKKYLSKKEYNLVLREVNNYFDVENMECIKTLTLEEIIFCTSLLIKLGKSDVFIQEFIKKSEKRMIEHSKNPIALYNSIYPKLNYYEEEYNLTKEINYLEECFKEIFICSNDEYEIWKDSIDETLQNVLTLLPKKYDYEIETSKKRLQ